MLRYAIDREVAADLCERHFGAAPEQLRFPLRNRVGRIVEGLKLETVVTMTLAVFVVVVVAGGVFGLVWPGSYAGETPDEAAVSPKTVTNPGGDGPRTVTVDGESSPTETGVTDALSVPGVNETGVINASRLAESHAATVAGMSSYTVWFDYYAPENGSPERAQYDVDVRVDGEQFSVQTTREETEGSQSLLRTVYFDGADRYIAENSSDEFSRIDGRTPTATPRAVPFTRPAEMVRLYLAVPESSISAVESDTSSERYRLRGTSRAADLPDTVTDYEVTAIVDGRGFVWMLEADLSILRDTDDDGITDGKRVRLIWTYDRVNRTEIRFNPLISDSGGVFTAVRMGGLVGVAVIG